MVSFIEEVIRRFGGRVAGTREEYEAQRYAESVLKSHCDQVEFHEFRSALNAKFHSLKGFVLVYLACLLLYRWNIYIGAVVALVNSVLFIGHFLLYRDWLDFLYKQHSSQNVIGSIEPGGELRSTLIISGHMDSVREFQWWYKWKQFGGALTTLSGFLLATQGPAYALAAAIALFTTVPLLFDVFWWSHLLLAPALVTFFFIHGKIKVDGALDNLTGVALAVEMAKVFGGENRLKHTRLKVISFGSEETGLRGSREYIVEHFDELRSEKAAVVNIDTIRSLELLAIVTRELNPMIRYPDSMVRPLESAFNAEKVAFRKVALPIGATDGAAFARRGIPAVSIIGLTTHKFDPTYHTRLDNLSNLDPRGLEALKRIIIRFVKEWDAQT